MQLEIKTEGVDFVVSRSPQPKNDNDGLRKGEVLGLTWDDVDLESAELTIGRQLQRVRGELLHRETKTRASDATLPLPPVCVAALQHRQAMQHRARTAARPAWTCSAPVFTTRYGDPIEPRNFNRYFTARCAAAGVRKITVHDARRTCATLLEMRGVAADATLDKISERLQPATSSFGADHGLGW